jgi:single-strand DNA-binding protein
MSSLNRATLIGNVGRDPEIKTMSNGNRVANLSIATSETWKDKQSGEKKERTEWHRVTVWNDGLIGVIEKYVTKGSKVMIEGQLQTRKYEQNGVDKYTTEIVLQGFGGTLILLGGKQDGERSSGGGSSSDSYIPPKQETPSHDLNDDIPF